MAGAFLATLVLAFVIGLLAGSRGGRQRDLDAHDGVGAVGEVDLAAVGEVEESNGGIQFALHDGEGAGEDDGAADVFHLGAFQHFGGTDGVGEDDAVAVEVEALILGVFARERAEGDFGHHAFGALGQGAGLVESAVEAPAGAGVGFEEHLGANRGARVGAVLAVEGDALGLHPAAGPGASAAERLSVEGITGFAVTEVHEDGLVRRAALLVEGALALGVIDRGREEAAVVHRFPL